MSIEKLKEAVDQVLTRVGATKGRGEEATKQALVLPVLAAMGYDIWNPCEVCPEYDADFAIKKNGQKEKVDIAIFQNNQPAIYIETKSSDTLLDGHHGQLSRYYNATTSVFLGILTNGVEWRFFTDTTEQNVMDDAPFHVVKLNSIDQGLDVMARFSRGQPNSDRTRSYATELRYTAKIATFLRSEIDLKDRAPSEDLIRWILKSEDKEGELIYSGVVNANVVNRFQPIVKNALTRVILDIVRRSVSAMGDEVTRPDEPSPEPEKIIESMSENQDAPTTESTRKASIVTTDEELALFAKIKNIYDKVAHDKHPKIYEPSQRKLIPAEIGYKDTSVYFCIYINKPSWWLARAYLDSKSNKWIGFDLPVERVKSALPEGMTMLEPSAMAESRVSLESVDDIEKIENIILMSIDHEIESHQQSVDTSPDGPSSDGHSQDSM